MEGFSFIMPCERNRYPLLERTLLKYKEFGIPKKVEFIIVTRDPDSLFDLLSPAHNPVWDYDDHVPIKVIKYEWTGNFFSSSMPINIGIRNSQFDNVVVTCPEVMPITNVLEQLSSLGRGNYVCQVFDETENGDTKFSLVNTEFRYDTPAMYFLACFKKEDLEFINGWDEDFMGTYAYEDNDFGARFVRAGFKFTIKDDIIGLHQYHPRGTLGIDGGASVRLYEMNNRNEVIRVKNGLVREQ